MARGPKTYGPEALRRLESQIDEVIEKARPGRVTISTKSLEGDVFEMWPLLKDKYLKAGWKKAEYKSEQRDGDYIDLDV